MSFFFGVDTIHGVRKTTCNALIIRLKLRHRFPHLYGCGHIEGVSRRLTYFETRHFRIFMDAATLKEFRGDFCHDDAFLFPHLYGCGHIEGRRVFSRPSLVAIHFRIFMDAATLKVLFRGQRTAFLQGISASLWMRPH